MQNEPNFRRCRAGWGRRGTERGANVQNEPNFGESFKCKVSSVKSGKPGVEPWESSYFRLYTPHFKLGRRPFVRNKPNSQGSSRSGGCGIRHHMPAAPGAATSEKMLLQAGAPSGTNEMDH
jgi:hypothetical protein